MPRAGDESQWLHNGPWPNVQLNVPATTLLVSIEGAAGGSVRQDANGRPVDFTGRVHRKTVQTLLRLGNNQPITSAAIMAAGDLAISALSSPTQLQAVADEVARLRSKGSLTIHGGVQSSRGEVNYGTTHSVNGPVTGTTVQQDDASGFYQLPLNKVRVAVNPVSLQAGTYVVGADGEVRYVNLNYAQYATASPRPTGTVVSLPAGLDLVGPNPAPTPRFRLEISRDVQIEPNGTTTDFALVPDGGAPQSRAYGGVPSTSPSPPLPTPSASEYINYWFGGTNPYGQGGVPQLTAARYTAWMNWADTLPPNGPGLTRGGVPYTRYTYAPGCDIELPNYFPGPGHYPYQGSYDYTNNPDLTVALQNAGGTYFADLQAAIPLPGAAAPNNNNNTNSPSPTPAGGLAPKDLELAMDGGTAGLTLQNEGSITIGAQIRASGASLISRNADIALIGTSTDLSSSPGTDIGLNLYAKGNIVIDTYRVEGSNAGFGSVRLRGVVYAWRHINAYAGNADSSAPFFLTGSMVAYGGDPAGPPQVGSAHANIEASAVEIEYDPSYVAGLAAGGPFTLRVLSWHEF